MPETKGHSLEEIEIALKQRGEFKTNLEMIGASDAPSASEE